MPASNNANNKVTTKKVTKKMTVPNKFPNDAKLIMTTFGKQNKLMQNFTSASISGCNLCVILELSLSKLNTDLKLYDGSFHDSKTSTEKNVKFNGKPLKKRLTFSMDFKLGFISMLYELFREITLSCKDLNTETAMIDFLTSTDESKYNLAKVLANSYVQDEGKETPEKRLSVYESATKFKEDMRKAIDTCFPNIVQTFDEDGGNIELKAGIPQLITSITTKLAYHIYEKIIIASSSQCLGTALFKNVNGGITGKSFSSTILFETLLNLHLGNPDVYEDNMEYLNKIIHMYYSTLYWKESDQKRRAEEREAKAKTTSDANSDGESETKEKQTDTSEQFNKALNDPNGVSLDVDSSDDEDYQLTNIKTKTKTNSSARGRGKKNLSRYD
jgi:hypothetical protein